jgi:hypothetical protein
MCGARVFRMYFRSKNFTFLSGGWRGARSREIPASAPQRQLRGEIQGKN